MKIVRTLPVLFIGLFLHLAAMAQANRLDDILARGVLRVGTTGDYKPFSYRANPASPFIGMDVELAAQLAKSLGVKLELVPTSWPGLMKDLADDRFDIGMGGISISLERQKKALYSIPYMRDGKTPITRCENQSRFQTLEQIDQPGVRLIVNPGGTNERFARANIKHASITVYPDNVTIFDQIVAGKADLMITDAIEARLQQKLKPQLCAVHPEAPFDFSEKAYLLPRDLMWKAFVDQWLHQTIESGAFNRQMEKWLSHPWPQAAPAAIDLEPLRKTMNERLALMEDVARFKWNAKAAIEDLPRERQIIDGLKSEAQAMGIPAPWAERFFRAQIEAAKVIQREAFAQWEKAGAGRFQHVPDLATEIRPKLDALTPRLLRELAAAWPALADPSQRERIAAAMQRMPGAGVHAAAASMAVAPLIEGEAVAELRLQ